MKPARGILIRLVAVIIGSTATVQAQQNGTCGVDGGKCVCTRW